MERPGDRFLKIFNELEQTLKKKTGRFEHTPFFELIEIGRKRLPINSKSAEFLQSMGNLRNAIIHGEGYPKNIVADPRQETVDKFQGIVSSITSPVRVDQKFRRHIDFFRPEDSLRDILPYMQKNDYSQVVVLIDEEHKVLTSEAIVRWLGATNGSSQGFDSVSALEVHKHEQGEVQKWIPRKALVDEALQAFESALEKGIPRLHAILITETGKPTEKPFGIITPWDLLGIYKEEA